MIEGLFLTFFIFLVPIFGKSIDSAESVIFYSIPIIISTHILINNRDKIKIQPNFIIAQIILILLILPSLFTSISFSNSYYAFFIFLNTILLINLSLILIPKKNFIKWIIIFSTIYSLLLILNKFNLINLTPKIAGDNFIMQFWGHSYFGDFLVLSIPCIIFSVSNPFILTINLIALILTNSRSALIGIIFAIFFYKTKNKGNKYLLLIFLIFSSLALWILTIQGKLPQKDPSGQRIQYWQQAYHGFTNRPFFGNGFNTFQIISEKYRNNIINVASQAHNSILGQLCDTGVFVTLYILLIIVIKNKYNFSKNNLFFAIFTGLFVDSLFDPVFSSPGITILAFYVLLLPKYEYQLSQIKNNKFAIIFLSFLTFIISIHAISKTTSDFFYLKKDYKKSIFFDHFNLNPQLKLTEKLNPYSSIWQQNINQMFKIAPYQNEIFNIIFQRQTLPLNEPYFYQSFNYNPKGNCLNYLYLANFYKDNGHLENLDKILTRIDSTFNENELPENCAIPISKINYHLALDAYYQKDISKAITYLRRCTKLMPKMSHYRIELAVLFWSDGNKVNALKEFDTCLQHSESKNHCQYYLDGHPNNTFGLPGESQIKEEINAYVQSN